MKNYSYIFFDCDGVILNSNKIKTEAFYKISSLYGDYNAERLVDYHIRNGGISRYKKIKFFLQKILKNEDQNLYKKLVKDYGNIVKQDLLKSEVSKGIYKVKKYFPTSKLAVISGSDQNELRWVFEKLKINKIFDFGIYGSPDSKEKILENIIEKYGKIEPAIFLGDSKYDFKVSKIFKLDFIFLSDWTEISDWQIYTKSNKIQTYPNICKFLKSFQ